MKALDAPVPWLIAFIALAWVQAEVLPLPFPQPLGRDIGAFAVLAGLFFVIAAVRQMRRHNTTVLPHGSPSELVTTGIFGKSRNPIYLGFVLILAGLSLWLGSILGLVLVPVLAAVLARRFIGPEEARLQAAFGPAWEAYAESTRRWL
jgi:protein-S-isoprenylcysteine O-methyltransferase Ste14